jgi:hypothetical protein
MHKLELINDLDQRMYNGIQKNERTVIFLIDQFLHLFPKDILKNQFQEISPIYLRNQKVNLKNELTKEIFSLLPLESTEMDILIINDTSLFGHKTSFNYYIEVEMSGRDIHASYRLECFADYCKTNDIILLPILITNVNKTTLNKKNISIINIDDLLIYTKDIVNIINPLEIPGIAWDNASIAYHIIDLISQKGRYDKDELNKELERNLILHQKSLNFNKLDQEKNLIKSLEDEETKDFRKRMHDINQKMEESKIIKDFEENPKYYTLAEIGKEYMIKWWG